MVNRNYIIALWTLIKVFCPYVHTSGINIFIFLITVFAIATIEIHDINQGYCKEHSKKDRRKNKIFEEFFHGVYLSFFFYINYITLLGKMQ